MDNFNDVIFDKTHPLTNDDNVSIAIRMDNKIAELRKEIKIHLNIAIDNWLKDNPAFKVGKFVTLMKKRYLIEKVHTDLYDAIHVTCKPVNKDGTPSKSGKSNNMGEQYDVDFHFYELKPTNE